MSIEPCEKTEWDVLSVEKIIVRHLPTYQSKTMSAGKQYTGEITIANVTKDILLYVITDLMPLIYIVSKKQSKLVVQMNPFCIFKKLCSCMHKQAEIWGDTP